MELTPEGEASSYAHVTAAMEQLRAGEAELQRQRELRSGMVSIAFAARRPCMPCCCRCSAAFTAEIPPSACAFRTSPRRRPSTPRGGLFAELAVVANAARSPVRSAGGDGAGLVP